jgi:hypothetical protein
MTMRATWTPVNETIGVKTPIPIWVVISGSMFKDKQ